MHCIAYLKITEQSSVADYNSSDKSLEISQSDVTVEPPGGI